MQPVTLTTERLVLRAPGIDDADAITAACQDPEIPRWTTVPSPYTRADAEEFIDLVAQWWHDGNQTIWGIFVDGATDGALVGTIGLHHIAEHAAGGNAELGYWMAAEARGRGYLVEAARAVLDWGFDERGLARIQWRAVVGNVASARAARALGFRFEGTQRQALTSARGRDDGWIAALLPGDDRARVDWPIDIGL
ncbi:GNAT family N-acetyltransferase [Microbacterium pseudoresistens]|uniref:RimJ/RimL family protein N-acetyltransferase n=1 Tax=Microbacterium pseudoresistens TaxID=640634 RepID=A0A7Y9EVQ0_9MICO|nr:GNAT family protein [Microbacterium pseudoresistens]NYD54825.1 RimJ/RimL family protein N-acetyltransferase [Microbacterium pseudoresistens]